MKKRVLPKKSSRKLSSRGSSKSHSLKTVQSILHMRVSYVVFSVLVVGLLAAIVTVSSPGGQTAVLGAMTQNTHSSFSFGSFFSSFFSMFAGKKNSNGTNSNGGWYGYPTPNGSTQQSATAITNNENTTNTTQTVLSQSQLEAMAGDKYADGNLPLGDNKYVTSGPKQGYVYICHVMSGGGGAQESGSWLGSTTWTENGKPTVSGSVLWPSAVFSDAVSGSERKLEGNGLPVGMTTGTFPIQSSDPAYQYDRNPNSIKTQSISLTLPVSPHYSDTPSCMGGEVGVMLDGVPLFNGFDAEMRDAPAHEIQDSCDGHPESNGEYHYHSLSRCITNTSITSVIGFALDGFPITGPVVSKGKYLTTADLDECHGITSEINLDGKNVTMYHYVMTEDFPYSASCFRGKPVSLQVIQTTHGGNQQQGQSGQNGQGTHGQMQGQSGMTQQGGQQGGQQNGGMQGQGSGGVNSSSQRQPPQAAVTSCSGQSVGMSCSFSTPKGTVSGTCEIPPGQVSALCVPPNMGG
jgi:hypothetical protein